MASHSETEQGRFETTASLRVAPYLHSLLTRIPSRYIVANETRRAFRRVVVEQRDVVCWYADAVEVGGGKRTVLVRIREQIKYSRGWCKYPLAAAELSHQSTLAGWWYK